MTEKSQISNLQLQILIGIIILASFLRFYQLSNVPPSPSLDEVSIGYNAYSILKTGFDEYGTKFPILLRAYDDWRPAFYVYLVIPFVNLLGLNVLAVRLPSVILSVITVLATYFLASELIRMNKARMNPNTIGLIAAFLLVISPWHMYISRLGHEVNVALTFFVLGFLLFLKAINFNTVQHFSRQRVALLTLSAIIFVGSFYAYQSTKIFIPFFVLTLLVLFRKRLFAMRLEAAVAGIVGMMFFMSILQALLTPQALIRFQGTNVLNTSQERFQKKSLLLKEAIEKNDILGQIVHNRRVVASQIILEQYASHFNPSWLFANRGADRHKVPNLGLFYIWEAPLILVGLAFLLHSKLSKSLKFLIVCWIMLAPLSASITTDAPHAMRTYTLLPAPQILGSLGVAQFLSWVNKYRTIVYLFMLGVLGVSLLSLLEQYFVVFPTTQSSSFQYALSKAIPYVVSQEKNFDTIVFSNTDSLYQSYMFYLFHSGYDPYLYQREGGTQSGGFAQTHTFGKFEFRPIEWGKESKENALYIGNLDDFPQDITAKESFSYLDGEKAIKIVERK